MCVPREIRTPVLTVKGWCPRPLDDGDNDTKYTMAFVQYLDLPAVPPSLIEPLQVVVDKPPRNSWFSKPPFSTRDCSPELTIWLRNNITLRKLFHAQYQLVWTGLRIHKDNGRLEAFNYLLNSGGENIKTLFYDDDKQCLHEEIIPLQRWHRIDTSQYHNVLVQPNQIRLAISLTLID